MSVYDLIIGHKRQIEQLERARRAGRVPHAYLFHGPDGVGKERVAGALARALNCTAATDVPCGRCESCQKIDRGLHPDVRLVATEEELVRRGLAEREKGGQPSAQIRNLQLEELANLFRHRPYLGRFKVVLLVDAERMNHNSQNRFLKTLEEPTADSVIILISASPDNLLPTVRSRCQSLAFGTLAAKDISVFMERELRLDPSRCRVLASMGQGSLGRAMQFAAGNVLEDRDNLVAALTGVLDGDLVDLLAMAESHGQGRERAGYALDLLEVWLRDLLLAGLGVSAHLLVNQDRCQDLLREGGRYHPRRLLQWIERLRRARDGLRVNANPRMTMEALLLAMRWP